MDSTVIKIIDRGEKDKVNGIYFGLIDSFETKDLASEWLGGSYIRLLSRPLAKIPVAHEKNHFAQDNHFPSQSWAATKNFLVHACLKQNIHLHKSS